ncbi:MAG: GNAT family N-acetyltransferase [Candidatus Wenzhouxiangella sp. M2_3B_020]
MVPIRRCTLGDAQALSRLMTISADRFVAHEFPNAGREHLLADLLPEAVEARMRKGAPHLAAEIDGEIVGMIAMTGESHVYQLFVDERHHRKGIARALWERARDEAISETDVAAFTVNASRYAVPFYERLGFVAESAPLIRNGVTCIPMRLAPERSDGSGNETAGESAD